MKVRCLRGWAAAVARAKQLWPEIPSWAFEAAGEQDADARAYDQADWFRAHPAAVAERALRIAQAKGWTPPSE